MLATRLKVSVTGQQNNPSSTFNGFYTQATSGSSTITFTGVSFGTAATGRIVVACVYGSSSGSVTINSVTIGGVSATEASKSAADARHSGIFYATVSTGSSGNVVVNVSGTPGTNEYLHVFSLYDVSTFTATDTDITQITSTGVGPTRSVTLNSLQSNSVVIGCWSAGGVASGGASTWTNLTEQADDYVAANSNAFTAASESNVASGNLTVTCTNSDTSVNRPTIIAAAWR